MAAPADAFCLQDKGKDCYPMTQQIREEILQNISEENAKYQDVILFEDIEEKYTNLNEKCMAMYTYVVELERQTGQRFSHLVRCYSIWTDWIITDSFG